MRFFAIGTLWLILSVASYGGDALLDPIDELVGVLNIAGLLEEPNEAVVSDSNAISDSHSLGLLSMAEAVTPSEKSQNSEISETREQFRDIRQRFLLDQMKSINIPADEGNTTELDVLIRQIEALQIPPRTAPAESPSSPTPSETTQTVLPAATQLPAEPNTQSVDIPASRSVMQISAEEIETALHPLALADVLYRQGDYPSAFLCYQYVLGRLDKDNITDRQWVLFQMANSSRRNDPPEAIRLYSELTAAYPNSKWTAIALSRQKTLEWNQTNRIEEDYLSVKVQLDDAE